jgi:hypothetical protein
MSVSWEVLHAILLTHWYFTPWHIAPDFLSGATYKKARLVLSLGSYE